MTTPTLYEKDFNLWIEQTVNQLKKGNLADLDIENLIEEIDSMGRSDKREIYSRLKVLLMHLLKWKYQPEKPTPSWVNTIDEQREQLELVLKDSPSLKPYFRDILSKSCSCSLQRNPSFSPNLSCRLSLQFRTNLKS